MRVRHILTLALGYVVLAGCGDSTSPAPVESQVSLMTIRPGAQPGMSWTVLQASLKSQPLDSTDWYLGLSQIDVPRSYILENGEQIGILATATGANGLRSDGQYTPTYRLLSDWTPVEPEKHPGVIYHGSEFLFRIWGNMTNEAGDMFEDPIPTKFLALPGTKGPSAATVTLEPLRSVRFVRAGSRGSYSCAGNDSLVLRANTGYTEILQDVGSRNGYSNVRPVREATIFCSVYTSVSAARVALANMQAQTR